MGDPTGFIQYKRQTNAERSPAERIRDFKEFHIEVHADERRRQGARCMDCGTPFCHSGYGCPVDNLIPEWNDLIYQDRWREAYERLRKTNDFPEYTGRVCPAPCESACVLGINEPAVTIKDNEHAISDRALREGWVVPNPPAVRTGRKVAIVGSGPAGLAAANQLNQAGHSVVVYERHDRIGGLLMYGIPNMKLDKELVIQRNAIMEAEGVRFCPNVEVGVNYDPHQLLAENDAVLLACGATIPRDLPIDGRDLANIHFAMDFLHANTKSLLDSNLTDGKYISAKGKDVVVLGGGDTGTDCIGTAIRHGARSITNFELLPQPAPHRTAEHPWPQYPLMLREDYGHSEARAKFGKDPRQFARLTKKFSGNGSVQALETVQVEWHKAIDGKRTMREVPNSTKRHKADLVLLAMGFIGTQPDLPKMLQIQTDPRTNIQAEFGNFRTSNAKVFAAGDARRGQSLVVWAIKEGREAARAINAFLA